MKSLINGWILGLCLLVSLPASANVSCRIAIDSALKARGPGVRYLSAKTEAVGYEGLFEMTVIALAWTPKSDVASGYYYVASATCRQGASDLELWTDLFPGEGGVSIKTISKLRN